MRGAGRKGVRGGFLQAKPATARSTAGCTAGCTAHMAALYRMYITVGLKAHTRPLVSASSAAGGGGGGGRWQQRHGRVRQQAESHWGRVVRLPQT